MYCFPWTLFGGPALEEVRWWAARSSVIDGEPFSALFLECQCADLEKTADPCSCFSCWSSYSTKQGWIQNEKKGGSFLADFLEFARDAFCVFISYRTLVFKGPLWCFTREERGNGHDVSWCVPSGLCRVLCGRGVIFSAVCECAGGRVLCDTAAPTGYFTPFLDLVHLPFSSLNFGVTPHLPSSSTFCCENH